MKKNVKASKLVILLHIATYIVLILSGCKLEGNADNETNKDEFYVAAYVWPSQHDEEWTKELFWKEGIGEWEVIKKGSPRAKGHYQPKVPLWGYMMDNDPAAWEQKIDAATDHGVNTFIFDWYWYDGKPCLEEAVNEGFLKADNCEKANFYLMWANHDMYGKWNPHLFPSDSLIFPQNLDWDKYKALVGRVTQRFFKQKNYLKIQGEPIFSIYNLSGFVNDFGGLDGAKKAFDYFRGEVKKAGFPGLHIQIIGRGKDGAPYLIKNEYSEGKSIQEIVSMLGIKSVSTYNWTGSGLDNDYIKWGENAMALQNKWDSVMDIPYFPNASIAYDDTPRFLEIGQEKSVYMHNSPESFGAYLQKAREYCMRHPGQPNIITVFAWNEWVEGAYLEPDMRWGYSYLETVKKVMSGKYDKYSAK